MATGHVGRELWRQVRHRRARLAVVIAAVLGASALEVVPPLIVRIAIDERLVTGGAGGLGALALAYLAATGGRYAFTALYGYQGAALAQSGLHDLRVRLFEHTCRLPLAHHDRTPVGDTISRATADLDTLQDLVTRGVVTVAAGLVPLVALGATMVALSPPLALVALAVVPPTVMLGRALRMRLLSAQRTNRAAVGRLASRVDEDVAGQEVIRAFRWERAFGARFQRVLQETLAAFTRSNIANTFFGPTIGLVAAVVVAVLLVAGAVGLGVTAGTLAAFVLLFQRFVQPLTSLGEEWQRVQEARAGAERVWAVLRQPAEVASSSGPPAPPAADGPLLELRSVRFGYVPDQPVLDGLDLVVRRGEHVAIVGPSGAGKSTLVELATGLRRPDGGSVAVAGADPCLLADRDRRPLLGYASQTLALVGDSPEETVTLGDPRVTAEELDRALATVGLAGRSAVPGSLSGGERQLLAVARALVLGPRVVLLDEATALVDAATDAAVRHAVAMLVRERGGALVTVAHRLAAAVGADRVVIMEGGRIVEEGHPAALLAAGGPFAALVATDTRGWLPATRG